MNKILVELKLTEIPEQYNEQAVREGHNERIERLHNTLLTEHYSVSPYANHEQLLELRRQDFRKDYQDPISGNIVYTKREHYAFTKEVKELLDKLYTEERQKLEKSVREANNNAMRMLDDARRSQEELEKIEYKIINTTFWQRVKYLFGGDL
jgi:hypothetical protein